MPISRHLTEWELTDNARLLRRRKIECAIRVFLSLRLDLDSRGQKNWSPFGATLRRGIPMISIGLGAAAMAWATAYYHFAAKPHGITNVRRD